MKKYIIKTYMGYLESHCSALVWKPNEKNAKIFESKKQVLATAKRWGISIESIKPI